MSDYIPKDQMEMPADGQFVQLWWHASSLFAAVYKWHEGNIWAFNSENVPFGDEGEGIYYLDEGYGPDYEWYRSNEFDIWESLKSREKHARGMYIILEKK